MSELNEILVKITDSARETMSDKQAETLAWKIIGHAHNATEVIVGAGVFGLPADHLYTIWKYPPSMNGNPVSDFHMGIDPEGRCSS